MDSPRSFELCFLDHLGDPVDGPLEGLPGSVELLLPEPLTESLALTCNGRPLEVYVVYRAGKRRVLADWPPSGPGHYRLEVSCREWATSQVVSIWPRKIDRVAFGYLLRDLESRLPTAVALSLQRIGALAGLQSLEASIVSPEEELVRLRRVVLGSGRRAGLVQILRELAREPLASLWQETRWVQRERARRPHPARVAQAASSAYNLDSRRQLVRVLDSRTVRTWNVYENRFVAWYATLVARRLRRLDRFFTSSPQLKAQTQQMLDEVVAGLREARYLANVEPLDRPPDRVTMALAKRPAYRAALEGYLEFRQSYAVRLDEPALEAPLENLPVLYQLWGTLLIITAFLDTIREYEFEVIEQRLIRPTADGLYVRVLPDGRPAVVARSPDGRTVARLVPNRSYSGGPGLRSVSFEQRPDVAIEFSYADGRSQVVIFDPKYKLDGETLEPHKEDGRPKKVDIDKMHAYRDAIVDARGERVVQYAAILYPGQDCTYHDGLEALRAYPTGTADPLVERIKRVLDKALARAA